MYGKNEIRLPLTYAKFYQEKVVLSKRDIAILCFDTKKQSDSSDWFKARRIRITQCTEAHITKTMKRKTNASLLEEFLNQRKFSNKSTEYGLKNRRLALESYKRSYDVHVFQIGLFVSPRQPWLGVSVDGIVVENECVVKLVEVKCPR